MRSRGIRRHPGDGHALRMRFWPNTNTDLALHCRKVEANVLTASGTFVRQKTG